MHQVCEPPILYFGTPVVLISSVNEDGSYNLAPISSIFWLGWRCMIGISAFSQTTKNILREKTCVLNLPSEKEVAAVNKLALLTGTHPVPEGKRQKGYRYEPDKFGVSGLTPVPSITVEAPRVQECPVQLEAEFIDLHPLADDDPQQRGRILTLELRIRKVHAAKTILMEGHANRIDPNAWRPLIMSFQQFYGLGPNLQESTLATIPERLYTTPDLARSREMSIPA